MIQAVVSVFTGKDLKFQVTPKQRQSGIYLSLIIPQLSIFVLTFLGMFWCTYLFTTSKINNPTAYIVNAAWAIYNLSLLWSVVRAAVWQPEDN
jgi:cellulose synthase (UDP-forming)